MALRLGRRFVLRVSSSLASSNRLVSVPRHVASARTFASSAPSAPLSRAVPTSPDMPTRFESAIPMPSTPFEHYASPLADAAFSPAVAMPDYMKRVYWWAYLQPWSPKVFDHPFVVNMILWGNYNRLRDAAVAEYRAHIAAQCAPSAVSSVVAGDSLQIACAYGSISPALFSALEPGARLEIVDLSTVQLDIVARKVDAEHARAPLPGPAPGLSAHAATVAGAVTGADDAVKVFLDRAYASPAGAPRRFTLRQGDAAHMGCYSPGEFGFVLSFFLLHEVPADVRREIVTEAFRVAAPGARLVFVDYHEPIAVNPVKPIMRLVNRFLEPFADDLWAEDIDAFLPAEASARITSKTKELFFGGLYQKVVYTV